MTDEVYHHQNEEPPHLSPRGLIILIAIATMVGVSGFFMGLRQSSDFAAQTQIDSSIRAASAPASSGTDTLDGELPLAPRYSELATAALQANRHWQPSLATLPTTDRNSSSEPVSAVSAAERKRILQTRAERRAYDGAPPTVPHPIDQTSSNSCLACHGHNATVLINERRPPVMSHEFMVNCIQCHVPTQGAIDAALLAEPTAPALGTAAGAVGSSFIGHPTSGPGSRAYDGAPPTIPHPTLMRGNCMSCHGPNRPNALRTTHAERVSCTQCHAPAAALDQRSQSIAAIATPLQGIVPAPQPEPEPQPQPQPQPAPQLQPPVVPEPTTQPQPPQPQPQPEPSSGNSSSDE